MMAVFGLFFLLVGIEAGEAPHFPLPMASQAHALLSEPANLPKLFINVPDRAAVGLLLSMRKEQEATLRDRLQREVPRPDLEPIDGTKLAPLLTTKGFYDAFEAAFGQARRETLERLDAAEVGAALLFDEPFATRVGVTAEQRRQYMAGLLALALVADHASAAPQGLWRPASTSPSGCAEEVLTPVQRRLAPAGAGHKVHARRWCLDRHNIYWAISFDSEPWAIENYAECPQVAALAKLPMEQLESYRARKRDLDRRRRAVFAAHQLLSVPSMINFDRLPLAIATSFETVEPHLLAAFGEPQRKALDGIRMRLAADGGPFRLLMLRKLRITPSQLDEWTAMMKEHGQRLKEAEKKTGDPYVAFLPEFSSTALMERFVATKLTDRQKVLMAGYRSFPVGTEEEKTQLALWTYRRSQAVHSLALPVLGRW